MRTLSAVTERTRLVGAFASSGSPGDWIRLAILGWARGNPSGWLPRRAGALRVAPAALRGQTVVVDPTDLGHLISYEEIFVRNAYDLGLVPFEPRMIVDCGAHAGFFAALAAAAFPHTPILAFEPNPLNVAWLRQNLDGDRVTVHDAAVSIADGYGPFAAGASNAGRLTPDADTRVRVVDLRRQLPSLPDLLLKLDVEGEEVRLVPHVLPVLPARCALFIETHDGRQARQRLSSVLSDAGFAVTQVRQREPYADVFALRTVA